ncbi:MAG: alcohol dehydrogenase catalytic domain-containing protein [Pirellulaceae bacterium]|nr:alcohol dehydrogenase catalytic domain-containing protein [Pirellulaceae bacterium]
MQAICFESVQHVNVRTVSDPIIEHATDAIVRVHAAGLCGSDLHPFFGRETGMDVGAVMGHEFVGEVIASGKDVRQFHAGDRVAAPFTTNCGECYYCKIGLTSRCQSGQLFGWRQNQIGLHGGQAEFVRVPLADTTLMSVPPTISDDVALLLGDNLSTGFYCAEMASITPDCVYVVIGCGTVGLLAIASAFRLGATHILAIDPVGARRQIAQQMGAETFSNGDDAVEAVMQQTDGRGADGVMELVGLPDAQTLAIRLVRPGGVLSVIGCHCTPNFSFSPATAYDKNLTYRTGRCPARHYMSRLQESLLAHPMDLSWCVTHRYAIGDAIEAYDTFAHQKDNCVKAVIDFPSDD